MSNDVKLQRAALMRNPNFRWLLGGGVISMLGDQMTMIALPWLVLTLTHDALALGLTIAVMSIPRAVFILIGGALVDRYSPKRVLMLTKFANAVLLAMLTALTLNTHPTLTMTLAMTPHVTLTILYALALGLGLAQAFGIPSGTSIMPQAIAPEHLQGANGMLMGLRQLSLLAGPLLTAGLIALAGDGGNGTVANARGLALAFAFDCFSFLLSAWTLSHVTGLRTPPRADDQGVLRSIGSGLKMVWDDHALRTCFIYWGVVALFIGGAMQVALPVLASERLHGATSLGLLMAANGCGTLIGMAAAAMGGARLRLASFGATILLIDGLAGLLLMPFGAITAAWQGCLLLLTVGVLSGFMQIAVFTWIQRRVPPQMMGRAMSLFMFIFMGLAPLSAAAAGWLLTRLTLTQMFACGGGLLVLFAVGAALFSPMRRIAYASAPAAPTAKPSNREST
ncbi:MFS transporter [Rugamonas sp.]|uniref:MFS transporter n=1 Tax=Rugamonas sp. TaxID=1926287 RepID=UPI0025F8C990|nr:MFS transporter [Rugamonas sp.]